MECTTTCKRTEWATVGLALLALLFFVINAWCINSAQGKQLEIAQRTAQIQQGQQLSQLNNELVRALATAVVQNKDEKIKNLLAEHGITIEQDKKK